MNGILSLGHFCESHGPCLILCTQTAKTPQLAPHLLTAPVCDACKSIGLDQAFASYTENANYFTTRIPLKQDVAFLLKQACIRSLSCEEENSKDGGTVFFGDNERGHVLSHTFLLQDSLARGFHRKFSFLMLMRDKVYLLNSWPFLTKHMRELELYLHEKASIVNKAEQAQCPQRAFRQVQGGPGAARSLAQLTGIPAVFGHIHLWFCWMLNAETVSERFHLNTVPSVQTLPTAKSAMDLRSLSSTLDTNIFTTLAYCIISGVPVKVLSNDAVDVIETMMMLLPLDWRDTSKLPIKFEFNECSDVTGEDKDTLVIEKTETNWNIRGEHDIPSKLPTFLTRAVRCLQDRNLPSEALSPQLDVLVTEWFNIAQSLVWCGGKLNQGLLRSLGVQSHDLAMIKFWMSLINLSNC